MAFLHYHSRPHRKPSLLIGQLAFCAGDALLRLTPLILQISYSGLKPVNTRDQVEMVAVIGVWCGFGVISWAVASCVVMIRSRSRLEMIAMHPVKSVGLGACVPLALLVLIGVMSFTEWVSGKPPEQPLLIAFAFIFLTSPLLTGLTAAMLIRRIDFDEDEELWT